MDSERFKTPKTDFLLKSLQWQRVLSAWIPGLLTLKIQGSVALKGNCLSAVPVHKLKRRVSNWSPFQLAWVCLDVSRHIVCQHETALGRRCNLFRTTVLGAERGFTVLTMANAAFAATVYLHIHKISQNKAANFTAVICLVSCLVSYSYRASSD